MNVHIDCPCGQPYTFDVEPSNGRMPVEVQCPTCGRNGTDLANAAIAAQLSQSPVASTPIRVQATASLMPEPSVSEAVAAPTEVRPREIPKAPVTQAPMFLGFFGAAAGGLAGMIAWYLLIKVTGYEIGYAAWGVGVVTGLGARMLAKRGNQPLGYVAGACALVAVLGGQYLAVKSQFDASMAGFIEQAYDKRMNFARAAIQAESDETLKALLASYSTTGSQPASPQPISDEEITQFRNTRIPELKAFLNGTPTRPQFEAALRARLNSASVKAELLKESLSLFTLLWIFLGVGSAYRIAARNA